MQDFFKLWILNRVMTTYLVEYRINRLKDKDEKEIEKEIKKFGQKT